MLHRSSVFGISLIRQVAQREITTSGRTRYNRLLFTYGDCSLWTSSLKSMNKKGPIIIIEDDEDDQLLLELVFQKLDYPNKLHFFHDGEQALDYLNATTEPPFLILSDINMPKLDGFALRHKIHVDAKLQIKCIPYLFFSTAVSQKKVIDAYSLSVQGFFVKQTSMNELEKTISVIMEYWLRCAAPNNY